MRLGHALPEWLLVDVQQVYTIQMAYAHHVLQRRAFRDRVLRRQPRLVLLPRVPEPTPVSDTVGETAWTCRRDDQLVIAVYQLRPSIFTPQKLN